MKFTLQQLTFIKNETIIAGINSIPWWIDITVSLYSCAKCNSIHFWGLRDPGFLGGRNEKINNM